MDEGAPGVHDDLLAGLGDDFHGGFPLSSAVHGNGDVHAGFGGREDAEPEATKAAVLDVKLGHLDNWNRMRQEKAAIYARHLGDAG